MMDVRAAVAFDAGKPLEIVTVQLEDPGPGEVLVRMKASGVCHSDLSVLEGKIVMPHGFPMILGHEGAGVVVGCGASVTSVQPGDHVIPVSVPECRQCANCLSGRTNFCLEMARPLAPRFSHRGRPVASFCGIASFAEFSVIPETRIAKIDAEAPDDIVCCIACGVITGVNSVLETAKAGPGSSVAVIGLGGIGLNALQGARIAGAATIIGIDVNPARETIAREYGATHFINPRETTNVVETVIAISGGGVDYSLECVGSIRLLRQAIDMSNPGWGVIVSVGIPGGGARIELDPAEFMLGRSFRGSLLGGGKPRTSVPRLVDWYQKGFLRLDELVTHRLALDEVNRGFDLMRSGEAIRSVIVY